MSFGSLGAFWWALMAIPIVALYILRLRIRREPVSTMFFWNRVFEQKPPRAFWQKLRHPVSLLAQLVLLALLVLAISDPFFASTRRDAVKMVIVIDDSASMQATDVSPNRLERAKDLAEDRIEGVRAHDSIAIVTGGAVPRVLCGFTGHVPTLREAVERIEPRDGPSRGLRAIDLARRLLGSEEGAEIWVLSDGGFEGFAGLEDEEDVVLEIVGEGEDNVSLSLCQARRSLVDPIGYELLLEVVNHGQESVQTRLFIDLDERPLDVIPLTLEPGQIWHRVLEKTSHEGGLLEARLELDDALRIDNRAFAVVPPRVPMRVTYVGAVDHFLVEVLSVQPLVDLRFADELPAEIPRGEVVVLHGTLPERLPPGALFVVSPAGRCDLFEAEGVIEEPLIQEGQDEISLLRHVHLQNVYVPEARTIRSDRPFQALVSSLSGDPLYASFEREEGPVLVLAVDLTQGDLPLRTAFPILIANALQHLSRDTQSFAKGFATGETIELHADSIFASGIDESSTALELVSPGGMVTPLLPRNGKVTLGPLQEQGVFSLRASNREDTEEVRFACNLQDPREGDLAVAPMSEPPRVLATLAGASRPIWFWLVAAAFLLMLAEWILYQRRLLR